MAFLWLILCVKALVPAATIVAGNSPLPASLAGRTGRVPVTAPSRWQLLHKSMWPLCVSVRAFWVTSDGNSLKQTEAKKWNS